VADLFKIVNDLSNLTVLEAAKLAKILEEKWDRTTLVPEFISEDDLKTFEGWLRYHAGDVAAIPPDQLAMLRVAFDKGRERSLATPRIAS
jgi:Ribosomal protein L7/L12 dimerisation domain